MDACLGVEGGGEVGKQRGKPRKPGNYKGKEVFN